MMIQGFKELGLFHTQGALALIQRLRRLGKIVLGFRCLLLQGRLPFILDRDVF